MYDWSADVMAERWSAARALKKLHAAPDMLVCGALRDQAIFETLPAPANHSTLLKEYVAFPEKLLTLIVVKKHVSYYNQTTPASRQQSRIAMQRVSELI